MNKQKLVVFTCLFIITLVGIGVVFSTPIWDYNTEREDIYYIWLEGKRILSGENPYARILLGDMRDNDKYATYFPLFYLLSALTQLLGFKEYSAWVYLWRHVFLFFNLGISYLIFYQFYNKMMLTFGFFASFFWLLNRWTIHVTQIAHIDFVGLFFLLFSLAIFHKHKRLSFLLFGLSLSLKQIAIFLLPLYLIWTWQESEKNKLESTVKSLLLILIIPIITSLPFIIWNAEGFFKSIIFSATRSPAGHLGVPSIDELIGLVIPEFVGIKAKLPMLLIMSLVFIGAIKRQIGIYTSVLLTMFVFVDFNSVLFRQYLCWVVPFIPLAIGDTMSTNRQDYKTK
ncbi:MAG: hypothetical protein F6J89_20845 [Symploca sp. SIO1C4]|uniref:DUF2029 domain-containing protein n=1 Tax=Symploca sp. SIO1C4 TaxID=2607765 RepID=A0A6B3N8Q3_9CYAN|nr:hypothetical protein [Symploca sp. SIO1C4]NET05774.1 hypothetical protein [Symploca sp. SIO2B6]